MRTGIWLVGARGSVGTCTVLGAAAIRAGLIPPIGCVSSLDRFRGLPLPGWDDLVFGGHDIAATGLPKRAERLAASGVVPHALVELLQEDLRAADREVRPGCAFPDGDAATEGDAIDALTADIAEFRRRRGLDRVIVVNVSSTEPPARPHPAHASPSALRESTSPILPMSARYACAAFLAGCPFVDFTPAGGLRLPAVRALAARRRLPYAGSDGKTGETLVKSVIAPMFARRALRVRSWSGTNLLGGGDGATLADPDRAISKATSKEAVLKGVLGHPVDGGVHIHHVPELGEWKTAWDHITFEGFFGTRMSLQFVWQGCDSALAAPLVLDLARFMALSHRAGVTGPVAELAFFFKDPLGAEEHGLEAQFLTLTEWARRLRVTA